VPTSSLRYRTRSLRLNQSRGCGLRGHRLIPHATLDLEHVVLDQLFDLLIEDYRYSNRKTRYDTELLVSFMDYDLGYIDLEEKTLQPLENPFGPKVLPMS